MDLLLRRPHRFWHVLCIAGCLITTVASAQLPPVPGSRMHKRAYLSAVQAIWGLNYPAWLAAQVEAESLWIDKRVSSANAQGICQFIPPTAEGLEKVYLDLAKMARYSPYWCYYAQSLLMRDLYDSFLAKDRTQCDTLKFATAGYNGSPATLRREMAICAEDPKCDPNKWELNVGTKSDRRPEHFLESRTYVRRIGRRESVYTQDGWGKGVCLK